MEVITKLEPALETLNAADKPRHMSADPLKRHRKRLTESPASSTPGRQPRRPSDAVWDPMNCDFASGQMSRPGSVQRWIDRKNQFIRIEMRR